MSKKQLEATLKLLTPELRKKVEDRQEWCYLQAEKHFERKFDRPVSVRYDIKNWTGGLAYGGLNKLRYNLILLVENEKDFLENTVPHEVAHLITRAHFPIPAGKKRLMPHGKEWKSVMTDVFKLKPEVKHHYDVSSIEKTARKPKTSKQRVQSAINIIQSVARRVEKKFTPHEQALFYAAFNSIGSDIKEAA